MTAFTSARLAANVFRAEQGTLYVLATPLGNLRDITLRGLDILESADLILAEDTRVTGKLLSHYDIKTPMRAFHQHNERQNIDFVLDALKKQQSLALVSDAGTPAISDPGAKLIAAVREASFPVIPIPGASALTAAISAVGLDAEHFYFAGFLPTQKKAYGALLEKLRVINAAIVIFEAPHRVRDTVATLTQYFDTQRPLIIARELTKTFETISRLTLADASEWLDKHPETERGELVLIIDTARKEKQAEKQTVELDDNTLRWLAALIEELPPARAARVAASVTGIDRAFIYEEAMRLQAQKKYNPR